MDKNRIINEKSKDEQLERFREDPEREFLTTNQGVRVSNTDISLKAGERGPTLLEDFHFREKITHFDHERIPERIVHARGSAAHGYFQVYESLSEYTSAKFLQDPNKKLLYLQGSLLLLDSEVRQIQSGMFVGLL